MLTHRVARVLVALPRAKDERGLSESTQWALVLPTLLAMVLGLVQTGVWLHGRSVAAQAAATAADLRATGAAADAARQAALAIASSGGLNEVTVRTDQAGVGVKVTVTGRVPMFFDFGQATVSGHAVLPVERVTAP